MVHMLRALVVALVAGGLLAPGAVARAAEPPPVSAAGAVLWDPGDGRVLHGVDARTGRPMASTTKIMTVLLALEAGVADETLTVSPYAAQVGSLAGVSSLGLEAGQDLAVDDVLAGLVLESGNDGAVAVAEHVAGSEGAFTGLMNARAAELGLDDTNFVNASGLTDDPANRASPRDLARLAEEALGHPEFAAWADAEQLALDGIGTFATRNELVASWPPADGVKTGFTALAGFCLVASATRGDHQLIAVVLDSDDRFAESRALLEFGFAAYDRVAPVAAGEVTGSYRWSGAAVPIAAARELGTTLRSDRSARWRTLLTPTAPLPVERGAVLGHAELLVRGDVVERVPLRAREDVAAPPARPGTTAGGAVTDALRSFARLAAPWRRAD